MQTPLVSVIIPNYNHTQYLNERIDSILSQTYRNFEIIILDDCSTDNSRDIIESYRTNPHVVHIIYNETNTGNTFLQWEKGLKLANGELCYIAESDDYNRPQLLEKMVCMFNKDQDVVLSCCKTFFVDDSGAIFDGICKYQLPTILSGTKFIGKYMAPMNYIRNAGMAVFKRDAALNISDEYKNSGGAGDYVFWVKIAEKGKVAMIHEPLNFFRRHEGAITGRYDMDGSNLRMEKRIFDYIKSKGYIDSNMEAHICEDKISYIKNMKFNTDEIKRELLELWKPKFKYITGIDNDICTYTFIDKLYNKIYKLRCYWYFRVRHLPYDKVARLMFKC